MEILYPIGFMFLVLLVVLWICLPFAVFGTKDKLNEMIAHNKEMLAELRALHASMDAQVVHDEKRRLNADRSNL